MKKMSILAIAATALLVSCDPKKKDENKDLTPKAKTRTELLTAGKWQVTASKTTVTAMGQTTTEDDFIDMDACDKDDFVLFFTDGKVNFDEGASKCDSMADQTSTGTWAFHDNETKVVITDNGFTDTANIDELTESVLKISFSYADSLTSYKSERTFGHIN